MKETKKKGEKVEKQIEKQYNINNKLNKCRKL